MTLTGILDIHDQLCQSPIHFVCLKRSTPVVAILLHLVPMAHHDEGCSEIQSVIGATLHQDVVVIGFVLLLNTLFSIIINILIIKIQQFICLFLLRHSGMQ